VSREHIDWSLLGDHGFGDLYVDPLWRHELIDLLIADSETKRYEVERVLGIYLRFGEPTTRCDRGHKPVASEAFQNGSLRRQ
jgi:hypothetical protein